MELNSYLGFNGQCEEAFKFYEKCLGGKIHMFMTYAESPMAQEVPSEWRNKIIHARMTVGDYALMGGDPPPGRYKKPEGFSVALSVDRAPDAERIFQALSDGGSVTMPLQKTFWAERFGMFVDRFGVPWMINCELQS